jgi:hypothetical protein
METHEWLGCKKSTKQNNKEEERRGVFVVPTVTS